MNKNEQYESLEQKRNLALSECKRLRLERALAQRDKPDALKKANDALKSAHLDFQTVCKELESFTW